MLRPLPSFRLTLAALVAASVAVASPTQAQTNSACYDATEETPEKYGPTDINAVTGNGGLSVGLNKAATVTVFKWPSPSFYDQIKYRTTDRGEPRFGALPNEGAFLGLAWRGRSGWDFDWLREWRTDQRFADDDTDEVVTTHRKPTLGLTVKVRDLVPDMDVLFRNVTVTRSRRSPIRMTRLISFANFNPVISKTPQEPDEDWCSENDNDSGAAYASKADVIVHERSGTDASTGEESTVALGMKFLGGSDAFHVGVDTYGTANEDGVSAYDDAEDGRLSGLAEAPGQADAALSKNLSLRGSRSVSTTVGLAAAPNRGLVIDYLGEAGSQGFDRVRDRKARLWREWLRPADLPRDAPRSVTRLAKRSLITLRHVTDRRFPLVMASISTQPPYGLDWIRDGSYINRALDLAGHSDIVAAHNRRYGELQATAANPPPGQPATPAGNWAQNYYADGVAGGPVPYQIDQTGFGIWTLWDHYVMTSDESYLLQARVYEAIQRAAHYLSDPYPIGCIDPTNNLQCAAPEGDNEVSTQTLVGAQAVWLGLDSASRAARVRGGDAALENAEKWETRRDELGVAIHEQFFDEGCSCYTQDYRTGGALLWPVGYLDNNEAIAGRQADVNYRHMEGIFSGEVTQGGYESKMLLGNAYAWAGTSELAKVRRGLEWVANVPTTNGTGLLGEAWMRYPDGNGPVTTMVAQPHATNHAMFYLAALKAYGRTSYSFD